jgi:SHS family lactate transporter-like MFS transporter
LDERRFTALLREAPTVARAIFEGKVMSSKPWWKEPTRGQWITFFAAWIGWVMDAFDFTIFLLVMPEIAQHFGVSETATTFTVTLTLATRLLGGIVAGSLADRFGRKLPLLISVVWFALCDGAIAFAPSFGWIVALRVLFGFGMGAEWTSGTTLAMENWPERSRGIASGFLQGSWAIGYLLASTVYTFVAWRTLFIIAALPALLAFPMRIWVPESHAPVHGATGTSISFRQLLSAGVLRRLVWASASLSLCMCTYYAFTGAHSFLLLDELHLPKAAAMAQVKLFNVGMLAGAVASGALVRRCGVLAAVVYPSLIMIPLLPLYVGVFPSVLWLGSLLAGLVGVGWSGIVPLYLTGLFAPEVRARAVGIAYHVGACVAALIPWLTALLKGALAPHTAYPWAWAIFLITAACELFLALLLLAQPKEMVGIPGESLSAPSTTGALGEAA